MQIDRLRSMLDGPAEAEQWLRPLGVANPRTGHAALLHLADAGVPLDLLGTLCDQFAEAAPRLADPGMSLNNLERFLLAARSPLSTAALFERDEEALTNLLLLFSASQTLSDLLCTDPGSYDLIRITEGRPVARPVLVDELVAEVQSLDADDDVMAALRRFKRRETLRIAYGDIVQGQSVDQVTRQISYVADAIVEAALEFATRKLAARQEAKTGARRPLPRLVVLALGKLGGLELNYSSDIDLITFYEAAQRGNGGSSIDAADMAARLTREVIRLLSEQTDLGFAYRVDMRLRPDGNQSPLSMSVDAAAVYYDTRGRTWERQAYVKARPIAGDIELGRRFLQELESWVYGRYLSAADISGIKGLKRRIESRAKRDGVADRNVKTGWGGIRDVEFVIQFLQLLNGGGVPSLRTGNTLDAIDELAKAELLTHREWTLLQDNYRYLRKVEHRLQIMYDLQTHELPTDDEELQKVAVRLEYGATPHATPLQAFRADYAERTQVNRKILDHLLHDAFPDDAKAEPEIDLVNEPHPSAETIERVLGPYEFRDLPAAYENLMSLATETIPFLSTRRCRLFLSSIAPRLLKEIAATPDRDATLVTLSRVSDSLGGKAALWELFSSNPPALQLCVQMCAACPYLAGILTSNPGMIDELVDSLLVEKLHDLPRLEAALEELTRGAEDVEPILHNFKNAQHLRVGVRDILGRDDIQATQAALSDVAEACLKRIVELERQRLTDKLGRPILAVREEASDEPAVWSLDPKRSGAECELIVLALGKLGGREPNYHSDLDLVFLYEGEGHTEPGSRSRAESTSNNHFFSQLGQRIIKAVNHFGPFGRLYEVDVRLRPTGRSGALALPLEEFVKYFRQGQGQLWERQALCKARVIVGSDEAAARTIKAVAAAIDSHPWRSEQAREIRDMRQRLEENASPTNLKRGRGGTVDAEFVVQMLQLKHGRRLPQIRVPGTLDGLEALAAAGCLRAAHAEQLQANYRFQRSVEARIRLMDAVGRHDIPTDPRELAKLAYLLGYADVHQLSREVAEAFETSRAVFNGVFDEAEKE